MLIADTENSDPAIILGPMFVYLLGTFSFVLLLARAMPQTDSDIPFVVYSDPNWSTLYRALEHGRNEHDLLLQQLSRSLEVIIQSKLDHESSLPDRIREKISRVSEVLDEDMQMLRERVLQPFRARKVLAAHSSTPLDDDAAPMISNASDFCRYRGQDASDHAYDSVGQVLAHIVRDWTDLGAPIRDATYRWCIEQIKEAEGLEDPRILVPGAGLGRLAWELASQGWTVEALEHSLVMASATASILQRGVSGFIHPYASEYFSNEVESSQRYEAVAVPDVENPKDIRGSMSYTVSDFTLYRGMPGTKGTFNVVVTCFFIDTATNVLDCMEVIWHILEEGGVWINVGPLQWHRNALVQLSGDELKTTMEEMRFDILSWNVDDEPIEYRSATHRSTHFDA